MKQTQSKGFTLIELLVVIAIGAILMAVIIGSLSDSRTRARDSKKISELKNVELALALYFDKNKAYPNEGSWNADLITEKLLASDFNKDAPTQFFYDLQDDGRYCLGISLEMVPSVTQPCVVSGANYTVEPRLGF